jgi:hypothetical protein
MNKLPAKQLQTGAPSTIGTSNSAGSGDEASLANHVHAHGAQTDPTLHADVTQSADGFMSAADKVILDAMTSAVKLQCKFVSVANIANLASGAPDTVDGNSVSVNDRVLVTAQSTVSQNGIYTVSVVGSGSNGQWVRSTDADTLAKLNTGVLVYVYGGSIYTFSLWALSSLPAQYTAKMMGAPLSASTPNDVAAASSAGTSPLASHKDHTHGHGNQATSASALHALAVASGNSGFLSGSDKAKLDGIASGADVTTTALAAASSAISVNSQRITNVADPSGAQDAATKAYVDAVASGLDVKASCRAATTANIATLAGGAPNTLDGVTLAANDRILVKNQSTGSQNGIYSVTTLGTGANGTWTRSTDADASAEVTAGMFTFVAEGTVNSDTGWVLTTNDAITLGSTSLAFSQFSGAGSFTDGAGLVKTGNQLDVVANADGSIVVNANDVQVGVLATDAQHGVRGGGTQHANVVAAGAAGFMTGADKTKLDGISTGADVTTTALAAASSAISVNSQRITNVADPTGAQDAATKAYVDGITDYKASVRCASAGTISNPTSGAPSTVDGVSLSTNDRVLVKDNASGGLGGIYTVTTVGSGANGVWARAADADASSKVTPGMVVAVQEGTANADTVWMLTNDSVTLGTTVLAFTQINMTAAEHSKLAGISAGADVTLTALAAAGSNIAVNSKRITTMADPTSAQDAATKAYVDAARTEVAFTASNASYALPSGMKVVGAWMRPGAAGGGGGGGGGAGASGANNGGGSSGAPGQAGMSACLTFFPLTIAAGSTLNVAIGAGGGGGGGGAAGVSGSIGSNGGATSITVGGNVVAKVLGSIVNTSTGGTQGGAGNTGGASTGGAAPSSVAGRAQWPTGITGFSVTAGAGGAASSSGLAGGSPAAIANWLGCVPINAPTSTAGTPGTADSTHGGGGASGGGGCACPGDEILTALGIAIPAASGAGSGAGGSGAGNGGNGNNSGAGGNGTDGAAGSTGSLGRGGGGGQGGGGGGSGSTSGGAGGAGGAGAQGSAGAVILILAPG